VIRHQESVVSRKKWYDRGGKRWAARSRVGNQRHATCLNNNLWKHWRHQILARNGKGRRERWMCMNDSSGVLPKLVNAQMHP